MSSSQFWFEGGFSCQSATHGLDGGKLVANVDRPTFLYAEPFLKIFIFLVLPGSAFDMPNGDSISRATKQ